jgi:hypothetical protein
VTAAPHADVDVHPAADPDTVGDVHGAPKDPDDVKGAANVLGKLNAAHASPNALEHASAHSIVGELARYKTTIIAARAEVNIFTAKVNVDTAAVSIDTAAVNADQAIINNPNSTAAAIQAAQAQLAADQAKLASDQAQLASDQAQLAAAQAQIVAAQNTLASESNKELTAAALAQVNSLLGL